MMKQAVLNGHNNPVFIFRTALHYIIKVRQTPDELCTTFLSWRELKTDNARTVVSSISCSYLEQEGRTVAGNNIFSAFFNNSENINCQTLKISSSTEGILLLTMHL